jgi:hypothetical protein
VLVAARPPARLGAAAGSQYADLPVFLAATSTAGTAQYFSGCFTARRPNNGDPSEPWRLYDATVTTAASGEEVATALAAACPAR